MKAHNDAPLGHLSGIHLPLILRVVFSMRQIAGLRRADAIEIQAGNLIEWR